VLELADGEAERVTLRLGERLEPVEAGK
jgi:hypothetical protein